MKCKRDTAHLVAATATKHILTYGSTKDIVGVATQLLAAINDVLSIRESAKDFHMTEAAYLCTPMSAVLVNGVETIIIGKWLPQAEGRVNVFSPNMGVFYDVPEHTVCRLYE